MYTHRYAEDGESTIHVFHTLQAQEQWIQNHRRERREATPLTRREAENRLGRETVRRMIRQRHDLHFTITPERKESGGEGTGTSG